MAGFARNETEIADRLSRYLKAEMKRVGVTYAEHAEKLGKHGLKSETADSVAAKLKRGTFPATFLIASLAALEKEEVRLAEI